MSKAMNIHEAAIQPHLEKMNALIAYNKKQREIKQVKEQEWLELYHTDHLWTELSEEERVALYKKKHAAYVTKTEANSKAYHSGNVIIIWARNILTIAGNAVTPYYLGRVGPKTIEKIKYALSRYLNPIFDKWDVSKTSYKQVCISACIEGYSTSIRCNAADSVENPFGKVEIPKIKTPEDIDELVSQRAQLEKEFDLLHSEVAKKIEAIYEKLPYAKICHLASIKNIELI